MFIPQRYFLLAMKSGSPVSSPGRTPGRRGCSSDSAVTGTGAMQAYKEASALDLGLARRAASVPRRRYLSPAPGQGDGVFLRTDPRMRRGAFLPSLQPAI